ncbi:MAG: site-specific integrase [Ktedonobacteraceae bacterium]|nr:site-specific integrase [Ktedonobacteraceae bacterium]
MPQLASRSHLKSSGFGVLTKGGTIPPREQQFEVTVLTLEQIQKLLAVIEGHRLAVLFKLALATGMRRGEIMGLKWQDINFEQALLQVRRIFTRQPGNRYIEAEPKTEKSKRSIMLTSIAIEALKRHQIHQLETKLAAGPDWEENDLVFCTMFGTPLNPNWVLKRFKSLLKKAGLPDMRFHDLRHSAATLLLSLGVHPKIVQEILGHSRIAMTLDTYSHALPTMQREAMGKLGGVFKKFFSESDEPQENGGENPGDVSSG